MKITDKGVFFDDAETLALRWTASREVARTNQPETAVLRDLIVWYVAHPDYFTASGQRVLWAFDQPYEVLNRKGSAKMDGDFRLQVLFSE